MKKIYVLSLLLCLAYGLFAQVQSKVTKTLTPMLNSIPVVYQDNVQGGFHQVADVAERDAIPDALKEDGMLVWVTADRVCYQWNGASSTWGQVDLVRKWVEAATYNIGDLFLYNKTLVQARTSGTIATGANPIPDYTNWNIIGDNLDMTTASNSATTYTVPTASVDGYSGVVITQTASATAITVTPPTNTTSGRRFTLVNSSLSAFSLTVGTFTIPVGTTANLVWDGYAWDTPSSVASTVPFNGLTNATAINTEDNTNFPQTWNWTTATTQNPLSINANALTTGTLLGLNANALAGGTGLSVASTGTATTGNLLSVTSASAGAFSNGGARFNFTGTHTGSGFQIDDVTTAGTAATINANALVGGTGLSVASTGTATTGNLLSVTSASAGAFSAGGARFNFTGTHTGSGFQIDDVTTAGTAAKINANALAGGTGLSVASTGTSTTGNLLYVTSASTGAFSAGGARMSFTGAHTGNGVQIDDATVTGNALQVNANALTTGNGLSIASTGTGLTTGSLLNVSGKVAATTVTNGLLSVINTAASSTGTVATVQANSTAGSGITVLANGYVGIGKAAPTVALDVTGGANFSGDVKVSGILTTPSDIRLKTKIETLTDVLAKIDQLRGVSYEFINQQKYAKGPQVGVIAQELQKVFPELVTKGTDGYLSVNYSQLTGVLIQAVREQQSEIKQQQIEINELKEQMKLVMKKLEKL